MLRHPPLFIFRRGRQPSRSVECGALAPLFTVPASTLTRSISASGTPACRNVLRSRAMSAEASFGEEQRRQARFAVRPPHSTWALPTDAIERWPARRRASMRGTSRHCGRPSRLHAIEPVSGRGLVNLTIVYSWLMLRGPLSDPGEDSDRNIRKGSRLERPSLSGRFVRPDRNRCDRIVDFGPPGSFDARASLLALVSQPASVPRLLGACG